MGEGRNRVLIICTANVCRSPTAAFLLQARLQHDRVHVASAGLEAEPGSTMCPSAIRHVRRITGAATAAQDHRAVLLTAANVASADLILTATRDQRSAVKRLVPASGDRVFTLTEAAYLSAVVVADLPKGGPGLSLRRFAAILHRERWRAGALTLGRTSRRLGRTDPLSIPDVHMGAGRHRHELRAIGRAAVPISRLLNAVRGHDG